MSSNSWGHQVSKLTVQEMEQLREQADSSVKFWAVPRYSTPPSPEDHRRDEQCHSPKCRNLATHRMRYCYITGRKGRVSYADKIACADHAAAFAEKHGVGSKEQPA